MINVQLACEKSKIEHRCSNTSQTVACAQLSVSHKDEEIQNSNFEYESIKHPSEDLEEDDREPAAKRIKKEPEDKAQSWAPEDQIKNQHLSPGKIRKTMKLYSESTYLVEKTVNSIMM